jgi:hypothetical protein
MRIGLIVLLVFLFFIPVGAAAIVEGSEGTSETAFIRSRSASVGTWATEKLALGAHVSGLS